MRRTVLCAGIAVVVGLGVSDSGTAAGARDAGGSPRKAATITRKGPIGMKAATARRVERERAQARAASAAPQRRAAEEAPVLPQVNHPPMPAPEMPMGPRFEAPDLSPAPDVPIAMDPAPLLSKSFQALPDNNASIPPDSHGAVGPTRVMTVLNTEVRVQDRDGNTLSTETLNDFWGFGSGGPATASVFDPRAHFDPDPNPLFGGQGRWVWAAVQGAVSDDSGLLVGFSDDAMPTLGTGILIDADPANLVWADYPSVGFNKKWIVVQVNYFLVLDNSFVESRIYIFDKVAYYTGTTPPPTVLDATDGLVGSVQVPALTYDFTLDDLYLLQRWNSGAGALQVWRLSGAVGSESIALGGQPLSAPWGNSGPDIGLPAGPDDFAPQVTGLPSPSAGCTDFTPEPGAPYFRDFPPKLQTNDSRVQTVVYRAGKLWAVHTVFYPQGAPSRSSVQWWEIDPTTGARLDGGLVDDPLGDWFYAFPSLSVNRHGDVLIGYSAFEATRPAEARYSFRYPFDPAGTLRGENLLKAGVSCYAKDLGTRRNRWGDYSATVVDPTDDVKLWTIQEYAELADDLYVVAPLRDRWGTWWGMLDTTRSITIDDPSVTEGNAGTVNLTFTVSLSEASLDTVTVAWDTADGTATVADADYVPVVAGLITFAPGETTKPATVVVNGDTKYELDETLSVNLSSPTNAVLADAKGTGTIVNDDVAPPQISIGDVRKIEGNGGVDANTFTFPVTLSQAGTIPVSVNWATNALGTATPGVTIAEDFRPASGTVNFSVGVVFQTVDVLVHGDTTYEMLPDEYFEVVLSSPVGGVIQKGTGIGSIVDDDATEPGVRSLGVSSTTLNRLQWVNPIGGGAPTGIRVAWTEQGTPCGSYPADPITAPQQADLGYAGAGARQTWDHSPVTLGNYYCYSVWVNYGGTFNVLTVANGVGQPFDPAAGRIKWEYHTGATAIAAPTVGTDAIIFPSNDYTLHAVLRGRPQVPTPDAGRWPPTWVPPVLGDLTPQRSPIVPLGGGNSAFIATQDGKVHAVNAQDGTPLWTSQLTPAAGGGAPAGMFIAWGGPGDYVLVGTRAASNNQVYALDAFTGAVVDRFPEPTVDGAGFDLGAINGSFSVDYTDKFLYFGSWGTGLSPETLWCLEIGPPGDALRLKWRSAAPGNVSNSPVLRGNRVYVGDTSANVWAVDAADGLTAYSYAVDSNVKGFIWPDRAGDSLYFATDAFFWGLRDDGSTLIDRWTPNTNVSFSGKSPSIILFRPGTSELYVGVDDYSAGESGVVEIDLSQPDPNNVLTFQPLDSAPRVIGAPSLDIGHGLLHVGSEAGILYAVEVPF